MQPVFRPRFLAPSATATAPAMDRTQIKALVKEVTDTFIHATEGAVSAELPEFLDDDPEWWYETVEAQFRIAKITSETIKLSHLTVVLPYKVFVQVREMLKYPYPVGQYQKVKEEIIRIFTPVPEDRVKEILDAVMANSSSGEVSAVKQHHQQPKYRGSPRPSTQQGSNQGSNRRFNQPSSSSPKQSYSCTNHRKYKEMTRVCMDPEFCSFGSRKSLVLSCYTHPSSLRLFLADLNSGQEFLVAPGSDFSLLSRQLFPRVSLTEFPVTLQAVDNTTIKVYGRTRYTVNFDSVTFTFDFLVTDTKESLIGADFLVHFGLEMELKNKVLRCTD